MSETNIHYNKDCDIGFGEYLLGYSICRKQTSTTTRIATFLQVLAQFASISRKQTSTTTRIATVVCSVTVFLDCCRKQTSTTTRIATHLLSTFFKRSFYVGNKHPLQQGLRLPFHDGGYTDGRKQTSTTTRIATFCS